MSARLADLPPVALPELVESAPSVRQLHPPPSPSSLAEVRRLIASRGKWVVQWDHLIVVPQHRLAYLVLGASRGRTYVVSFHRLPGGLLSFEGLYQLPFDWHGEAGKHFHYAPGARLVGERDRVIAELELRARSWFHITGDFPDATAERSFENWFHPREGCFWRWRTSSPTATRPDEPLVRALECAFQHIRRPGRRNPNVRPRVCLHCEYPFDGTGRRAARPNTAWSRGGTDPRSQHARRVAQEQVEAAAAKAVDGPAG